MRLIRSFLLFTAYVLVFAFGVLALASFDVLDYGAAGLCLVLTALALWGVLIGERALDAQALDEFEGEFMD